MYAEQRSSSTTTLNDQETLWLGEAIELAEEQASDSGKQGEHENHINFAEVLTNLYFSAMPTHIRDASIKGLDNLVASLEEDGLNEHELLEFKRAQLQLAELKSIEYNKTVGTEDPNEWISLHSIISSKYTYSKSLYDLNGINAALGEVAKIDRLPAGNTLEASLLLQKAWDCVDYYSVKADQYKMVAKLSHIFLLAVGVGVVACGVVRVQYTEMFSERELSSYILLLSILSALGTSFVAYCNPSLRWQQLRSSALEIESEIWMFRFLFVFGFYFCLCIVFLFCLVCLSFSFCLSLSLSGQGLESIATKL